MTVDTRPQPIKVLLIDDSQDQYLLLQDIIQANDSTEFVLSRVSSYAAGWEAIQKQEHDAYLIDHYLVHRTGLELIRQAVAGGYEAPMILLTGVGDGDLESAALEAGAANYLGRTDLRPSLVKRSLRYAIKQNATYKALHESEARFRALFEQSNDAVLLIGLDFRILTVNQVAAQLLGYETHEMIGQEIGRFTRFNSDKSREEQLQRLLAGQKLPLLQSTALHKDSREIPFEVSLSLIRDSEGKPLYIQSISRDIRARKQAEAALRESEQRFRALFEQTSDAILLVSLEGEVFNANQRASALTGYPLETLKGMDVSQLAASEFRDAVRRILTELSTGQIVPRFEGVGQRKDGSEYFAEISSTLIRDSTGKPLYTQNVIRDISERKRAETALLESEKRYRGLFEQTTDAIFLIDPATQTHITVNQRAVEMMGYTQQEMVGMSIQQLVAPFEQSQAETRRQDLLTGKMIPPYERVFRHKDGSLVIGEVNVTLARDEKGNPLYIQSVVRDIRERKRAEEAERQQRVLAEVLLDTASVLNSTLDLDEVLERILNNVGKIVPHDAANVMLVENGLVRVVGAIGYEKYGQHETTMQVRFDLIKMPILKAIVETRQPIVITNVQEHPDWLHLPSAHWVRSYVGVPILMNGEVIGFLNLDNADANSLVTDVGNRLQAFSNQVATAIQNARRYQEAQELSALQERQRLARELHDAVSQNLHAARITAEVLLRTSKELPAAVHEGLQDIFEATQRASAEMRSLLIELRPTALLETGMIQLFHQLIDIFGKRLRVPIKSELEGEFDLPLEVKLAFYRVAQETFNNIAKHAHATHVELSLHQSAQRYELRIRDNGQGFDLTTIPSHHHGVRIMRERAEAINAQLNVYTQPTQGTEVVLVWEQRNAQI